MFFNLLSSQGFLINKTSGYPLPIGMFSTFLKNPTYTGPIFNVRRSSDNVTTDVYSDANGNYTVTGGSTYSTWIGANTGYVTQWYNQSGLIHMYQTTTANQPQLLASSLDLSFNGTTMYLYSGSGSGSYTADFNPTNLSIATCCTFRNSGAYNAVVTSRDTFKGYTFYLLNNNTFEYMLGSGSTPWIDASSTISFATNTQYKAVLQCPQTGAKTVTINGTTNSITDFTYTPNTTYVTRIGTGVTESTPQYYFAGTLKDTFIYNTSISDIHRSELISNTLGNTLKSNGSYLVITGRGTKTIAVSSDNGINWTVYSSNTVFTTTGRDVAYGSQKFLALGEGGNTIAISNDGITWTGQASSPFSVAGYKSIWDGTKWIIAGIGTSHTLAYGTETNWTGLGKSIFSTGGYGLLYDSVGSKYFAVGEGTNTLATSTDGIGWTGAGLVLSGKGNTIHGPATNTVADPAYSWMAVGSTKILGSPDGSGGSWATLQGGTITSKYGIDYGNGKWISAGVSTSNYSFSIDGGTSWTQSNSGDGHWFSTKYANGKWVMGGWGNTKPHICYSLDNGTTWLSGVAGTGTVSPKIFSGECWSVHYGNGIWMAGGDTTPANTLVTSTDGITWSCSTTYNSFNVYWVTYANGFWVHTQNTGFRYSSDNGANWTTVSSIHSSATRAIAYGNGMWVAIGTDSTNPMRYASTLNGTWGNAVIPTGSTSVTGEMCVTTDGLGVWVACIGSKILRSINNGANWYAANTTDFTVARYVAYRSKRKPKYIIGGTGAYLMKGSDDGISWYEITDQPFSVAVNDVKWNGTIWVATGEGNWKIAYSTNGVNWIGVSSPFSIRANKLYWHNLRKWYATGEGTAQMASSIDGITWTAVTTLVDVSGIGLTYNY